jgi:hypothetical protein
MDTCTVETGLLRRKPCGHAAVTHCLNCEQPLCSQHAVAQHTETGAKSGKFMCKECDAARAEIAKLPPTSAKKPVAPAKEAPAKDAAAKHPAAKEAPAEHKPADDGGIDFTPTKK